MSSKSMPVRVLVVDDERAIRFFLEELLVREGYQVVAVESGEAALDKIATEEEFDLALVDLKMKKVGGLEVLEALNSQSPDTVAIVLTAHASLETAVEALRQGAHDYLFKPCKTVELRESIREGLLKRQQVLQERRLLAQIELANADPGAGFSPEAARVYGEDARFLRRSGLIVDLMRHVVTLDGHLLELSPTEFDLLAYLASEAPRVVSSQELVREVQGYDSELRDARALVRYHVYRIRRKMKAAVGRNDIICTVRGVGHMIGD